MNHQRSAAAALALSGGVALGALVGVLGGVMTKVPPGTGLHLQQRALGLGMTTGIYPALVMLVAAIVVRTLDEGPLKRPVSLTVVVVASVVLIGTGFDTWRYASMSITPLMARPALQALERGLSALPAVIAIGVALPSCGRVSSSST